MAHFQFEASVSELVRLDGPMQRAPVPRWQRKAQERKETCCWSPTSPMGISRTKSPLRTPLMDTCSYRGSKTPAKTPSKTPNKKPTKSPSSKSGQAAAANIQPNNQGDRFIPNRALMDLDLSNFRINNPDEVEEVEDGKEYNSALSEMLTGKKTENSKILTLKQKAPKAQEGYNNLKVLYSSSKSKSAVKAKPSRFISQTADRVLDAPDLRNDFYLTLMDWSARNLVAVALHDEVYLWNASTGNIEKVLMKLEGADDYICSVSWIQEGNVLAIGNTQGRVQLWDVEKSKCLRSMDGHASRVGALSWNAFILTSGSRSGQIHHHDVRMADHHVTTLDGHTQEICGLKWSPDSKYLASGGNDNLVNVWDAGAGTGTAPIYSLTQHQAAVKALAWCPWQPNILASGGGTADRHLRFWNCHTGLCLNSIDTGSQVSSILWSTVHKELISSHGFSQYQLSIWKYPMMQRIADLKGHTNRVLTLCMSPDQSTVISAAADETLRLWFCFMDNEGKKKKVKTEKTHISHALSVGQIR